MAGNPFLLNEPDLPRNLDTEAVYLNWFKVADAGMFQFRRLMNREITVDLCFEVMAIILKCSKSGVAFSADAKSKGAEYYLRWN